MLLLLMSKSVLTTLRMLRGGRLQVGKGVIANHRLDIRGPGRVEIGDRANLFAFGPRTRLVARRPEALIRIGENARLNGTFVQADCLVEIGPDCILGDAHILDTDMHSLALDRRTNPEAPIRRAPVILERNVWVAKWAAILPGVRVGEGSVVGYGSVVTADVPPGVVVGGNPARVIRELA
jgi:acetyltransferase-like isoleucine patch superfamily enzyme